MPSYNEMEHAFNVIDTVSKGWQQVKGCHSKDDQQARNVIIPMILSESTSSIHKTSLLIGIHHQNLALGIVKGLSLESQTNNALWALCEIKEERYISSRDS
jgi:hypothetical protein